MSKSKDVNWSQKKQHEDRAEKKKRLSTILNTEHDKEVRNPDYGKQKEDSEEYGPLP